MRGRVLGMLVSLSTVAPALAEDTPPPGFLEFLGALVEQDGELIDPLLWEEALAADPGPAEPDAGAETEAAATAGVAEEGESRD